MGITLAHLQLCDNPDRQVLAQAVLPGQRGDFQPNAGIIPPIQMSDKVTSAQGVVGSVSTLTRGLKGDLLSFYWPGNRFFQQHLIDPLTGLTTVANLLNGGVAFSEARQAMHRALLTGNGAAREAAYIDLGSSIAQTGVGAGFLAERVARLVVFIKNTALANTVAFVAGKVATFALAILFGFSLISSGLRVYKTHKLCNAMKNSGHRALFIQKKLNPDLEDLKALSEKKRNQLLQEALFYQREALKKQFTFAELTPPPTDAACDELLKKIYGVERLQLDMLAVQGREQLKRIGDERIIKLIELEKSSGRRLNPTELETLAAHVDEVASSTIDKVKKLFIPALLFLITVGLLLATHQITLLHLSTAFLGLELLELVGCKLLGMKGKLAEFIETLKASAPGKHDKKMLWLHLLTLVAVIGVTIGLSLAFPLLFPVAPLVIGMPVLVAWLAVNLYALLSYEKYEKERIDKAPTLANFRRYEQLEKDEEKIDALFKRIIAHNEEMQKLYKAQQDKRRAREAVLEVEQINEESRITLRKRKMHYILQDFMRPYSAEQIAFG